MPVYANQHGAVQTAYVGYKAYTLTANLQLFWPTSYYDAEDLVAAYMWVDQDDDGPYTITLPDATQVSVGENFIINNHDDDPFNVLNFGGGTISPIAAGTSWYFILSDNSTANGTWIVLQFGANTSNATPTALQGYGLNTYRLPNYADDRLNTQIGIKSIAANYTVLVQDYTSMLVWTAGAGTITLPEVSATVTQDGKAPPAYYVSVNHSGSGPLQITGAHVEDLIQGQESLIITSGQTVTLVTPGSVVGGSTWFTLGFGKQTLSGVTVLDKALSPGTVTLNPSEASNLIQNYTGTGPCTVVFPVSPPAEWLVYNNTNAIVTVEGSGGAGGSHALAIDQRAIFYSDNTNFYNIPNNIGTGTVTSVSTATTSGLTLSVDTPTTTPVVHVDLPGGGTANQLLRIVSTGPQVLGWVAPPAGSVTSVGVASTTGLAVTGSPVTGAGTINVEFGNSILLSSAAVPAAPVAGKAIVCVENGVPICRSAAGTNSRTGAIVTANDDGAAPTVGVVSLVAGTATIDSTAVNAAGVQSIILITIQGAPTALGACEVTVSAITSDTSFVITSSNNADARDVHWMIINPASLV